MSVVNTKKGFIVENKKESRFDMFVARLLYRFVASMCHDDYVTCDVNGNIHTTPANVWHNKMLNKSKQR